MAPRRVLERLGGGAGRAGNAERAGECDPAPKQGAAIDEAVARNGVERGRAP
jgi:hypothetical protein